MRSELTDDTLSPSKRSRFEFVLKYLLRTSSLVDKSDVSGRTHLNEAYVSFLHDLDTPFDLVDPILNAYSDMYEKEKAANVSFVQSVLSQADEIRKPLLLLAAGQSVIQYLILPYIPLRPLIFLHIPSYIPSYPLLAQYNIP